MRQMRPCAYWEVQLVVLSSFIDVRFQFGQVFHKNLHNSQEAAKFHKANLKIRLLLAS